MPTILPFRGLRVVIYSNEITRRRFRSSAMTIANFSASAENKPISAGDLGRCILWLLWQCLRVPAVLLLVILEPVVSFVLSALALLGVLTALFWKLAGPPHFP